ncbi:hypothetical protein ABZ791_00295 [Streptomyces huasconensis]|uniref:hypothetical protein n=1 Tax=Streptomyces huasconensis TaxID=1854574 RepID=UPI0033FB1523
MSGRCWGGGRCRDLSLLDGAVAGVAVGVGDVVRRAQAAVGPLKRLRLIDEMVQERGEPDEN